MLSRRRFKAIGFLNVLRLNAYMKTFCYVMWPCPDHAECSPTSAWMSWQVPLKSSGDCSSIPRRYRMVLLGGADD